MNRISELLTSVITAPTLAPTDTKDIIGLMEHVESHVEHIIAITTTLHADLYGLARRMQLDWEIVGTEGIVAEIDECNAKIAELAQASSCADSDTDPLSTRLNRVVDASRNSQERSVEFSNLKEEVKKLSQLTNYFPQSIDPTRRPRETDVGRIYRMTNALLSLNTEHAKITSAVAGLSVGGAGLVSQSRFDEIFEILNLKYVPAHDESATGAVARSMDLLQETVQSMAKSTRLLETACDTLVELTDTEKEPIPRVTKNEPVHLALQQMATIFDVIGDCTKAPPVTMDETAQILKLIATFPDGIPLEVRRPNQTVGNFIYMATDRLLASITDLRAIIQEVEGLFEEQRNARKRIQASAAKCDEVVHVLVGLLYAMVPDSMPDRTGKSDIEILASAVPDILASFTELKSDRVNTGEDLDEVSHILDRLEADNKFQENRLGRFETWTKQLYETLSSWKYNQVSIGELPTDLLPVLDTMVHAVMMFAESVASTLEEIDRSTMVMKRMD